jgi:asparagine synthase (glutamine-hydrolysing)
MAKEKRRRNRVSVQFGRWNIDGAPVDQDYLAKAGQMLAPYGPDGGSAYIKDNVGILFRAFHTTKESRKETQPFVTPVGAVVCWDGRLDNRDALVRELRETVTADSTDLAIVAAAYEAFGTKCFAKLIGDWALSVWDPRNRSVILAKDPIGTRHLYYYSDDQKQITWSTILDPLVLLAGKTFELEEEYIAGWLSFFPATHLTPYVGIHSVPPSCFLQLKPSRGTLSKYWDFDPSKRIRYRTDGEYEEHFRQVFGEAVRRRLRSDSPILAELSGGMDSSSIVCMADTIIASGTAETPRLDTISYYNDSEPNWNERPFFTKVEERRGRVGSHIDVGTQPSLRLDFDSANFAATPGSNRDLQSKSNLQLAAVLNSNGNRVVLSGTGGDEITGGVPTPTPELEDLIATVRLRTLAHRLKVWALDKKKPWFHLFFEAVSGFLPMALAGVPKHMRPATWLRPQFVKRHQMALRGYEPSLRFFGPLPSFQENVVALNSLRRQLACETWPFYSRYEKRYPYLDRDLIVFLYATPREQVVRPGQRRSLMRRALHGIVPDELLNRKRKAFVVRGPRMAVSQELPTLERLLAHMIGASLGIVDPHLLSVSLHNARVDSKVPVFAVMRTVLIEMWLRNLNKHGFLLHSQASDRRALKPSVPTVISAEKS